GPFHANDAGPAAESYLTFILSDGKLMFGFQAGKHLHYTTHKSKCPERRTCPFHNPCCEEERLSGQINHLMFASEPILGENIWNPMKNGQLIRVDHDMTLYIVTISTRF